MCNEFDNLFFIILAFAKVARGHLTFLAFIYLKIEILVNMSNDLEKAKELANVLDRMLKEIPDTISEINSYKDQLKEVNKFQ